MSASELGMGRRWLPSSATRNWRARGTCGDSVGVQLGERLEAWQVTPQMAPSSQVNLNGQADCTGELDLPKEHSSNRSPPALPPPSQHYCVLLQDRGGLQRAVLSMHRIPFWMTSTEGSSMQEAAVMYVGSG